MNVDFAKGQSQLVVVAFWFFFASTFLSLLIVAWKYLRSIVNCNTTLLIATLCYANTLVAQPNGERVPESSQVISSRTNVLGPPSNEGPTVVKAAFHLQNIDEIDDEAETLQFTGVFTLTWQDKRQAFDPDKEGGQEKIYQGGYQFDEISPAWYPQVVLENVSDMYEKHGVLLRVQPDGTSTLIEKVNAIAEVNLKLTHYPFDSQRLEVVFEVLGFDSSEVVFEAEPGPIDASRKKMQISQWQLADISSATAEKIAPYAGNLGATSTYAVYLEVQRKPFYIIRLVVIPLTLIVLLSWSVFWMERSSLGDRINISFVGILTAVAYQNVLGDVLPHISYFTWLNAFVNLSFLVMCASIVENLIVGTYDKQGKSDIGDLIDYRCRRIFPLVYFGLLLLSLVVMLLFF